MILLTPSGWSVTVVVTLRLQGHYDRGCEMDESAINYVYNAFNLCIAGHGMPPTVDNVIDTLDAAGLFGSYQDNLGDSLPGGELAHMNLAHGETVEICVNNGAVMYVVGR